MTPEQLRAGGIAAIESLTGAAAIDALIEAGLFPTGTEDRCTNVIFDDTSVAGIRTVQWQIEHRHVTDWKAGRA